MGRLCDRWGVRNTLVIIYLGMAASCVLFTQGSTVVALAGLAALLNVFVGGSHYTIYAFSPRLYPQGSHGAGVGAAIAASRIGAIVGPLVAGQLLGSGSTVDEVVIGLAPIALVCVVCSVALGVVSRSALARPAH
jgi:AAHS family 3-hydroxyphenylpropionic acid transporter